MHSVFHSIRFALFSLLLINLSCDNESDPAEPQATPLLKLTVENSFPTKNVDNWVMVHDKNGVLIDAKKFETGQVVTIETEEQIPDDLISVTLLSFDSTNTLPQVPVDLRTYSHLLKGQQWTLKLASVPQSSGSPTSFSIGVSGVNNRPLSYAVSSETGGKKRGYSFAAGLITSDVTYYEKDEATFMVAMELEEGQPKYRFIENVVPNEYYEFPVSNLQNFDHTLDVSFPTTERTICDLWTYNANTKYYGGFKLFETTDFSPRSRLKLGYLDRFDKYRLFIFLWYSKGYYHYECLGNLPKSIDFPFDVDFDLKNTSINEFSIAGNPEYDYLTSGYQINETGNPKVFVSWSISSPKPGVKILTFPKPLTDTYKFLNIDKFDHSGTTFFIGQSLLYDDFVSMSYKGMAEKEFEQYGVSVSN
jgi:hypothetical protein